MLPRTESEPNCTELAKRFVLDAVVAKNAVEVAFAKVVFPVTLREPSVLSPATFKVLVAVIAPPKNAEPDVYWLPSTASVVDGDVVPIPTLPLSAMVIR